MTQPGIGPTTLPPLDPTLAEHHGWIRIGGVDSAARRSLWLRLTNDAGPQQDADANLGFDDLRLVARIELRSGREGQDGYVAIDRSNPAFAELLHVLLDARFAAQT